MTIPSKVLLSSVFKFFWCYSYSGPLIPRVLLHLSPSFLENITVSLNLSYVTGQSLWDEGHWLLSQWLCFFEEDLLSKGITKDPKNSCLRQQGGTEKIGVFPSYFYVICLCICPYDQDRLFYSTNVVPRGSRCSPSVYLCICLFHNNYSMKVVPRG